MKTIYLIKSLAPFIFLPLAPGVVQLELMRQGLLPYGSITFLAILVQIAITAGVVYSLARRVTPKIPAKANFVTMSCVSKKVYHNGQWMSFEQYLADHHNIVVSHGMTPEEATDWVRESEAWLERESKVYAKSEIGVS